MISFEKPRRESLKSIASSLQYGQPQLLEKVYRAFSVLEGLAEAKLDFVFKGGTAVMLLLGRAERFSIDIDIICKDPIDLCVLTGIAEVKGFSGVAENPRKPRGSLKKSHYQFSYEPVVETGIAQETVLLDVLHEEIPYPVLLNAPVALSLFPNSGEMVTVRTPTLDCLCGDKLTAFAPNTVGIPYIKNGASATLEIAKQLFDIGVMFDSIKSVKDVRETFLPVAAQESAYREIPFDIERVFQDIVGTSLCIATEGAQGVGDFPELKKGISSLRQFIFSRRYGFMEANIHAAKTAYLVSLLRSDAEKIAYYDSSIDMKDFRIANKRLHSLKKGIPEAFFYWYQAIRTDQNPSNQEAPC